MRAVLASMRHCWTGPCQFVRHTAPPSVHRGVERSFSSEAGHLMKFGAGPMEGAAQSSSSETGYTQNLMMDLCMVPMGKLSVSKEVAAIEKVLRDPKYGLTVHMHAYGSNIQGDWDQVMAAVKEAHAVLHNDLGVVRITSSIRMGTRVDRKQTIEDKIKSAEAKYGGKLT
eukprot:TRINITY_DN94792_c0_g1_i1.p1 TRINITY_DN94792_c0_g1~~TRINITY_DN94792_c0_g1_i1.p1  ORF type:complete len:170 (-),score=18.60 TRINITY_DN94792_c0_g1_i1:135-644(-)